MYYTRSNTERRYSLGYSCDYLSDCSLIIDSGYLFLAYCVLLLFLLDGARCTLIKHTC